MNRKPDLGALIEANRAVTAPSPEDRRRNTGHLAGRIGAGLVAGAAILGTHATASGRTGAGASATVMGGLAKWVAVLALFAVGAGAIGLSVVRHRVGVNASSPASVPAPIAPVSPPRVEAAPAPTAAPSDIAEPPPRPHASSSSGASLRATAPTSSRFARQLDLLRSARLAIDGRSPATALAILDRYAAEFPRDVALRSEYEATRVFALCAAGRTADAEQARAAFLDRQPGSPLADRVRAACGGR